MEPKDGGCKERCRTTESAGMGRGRVGRGGGRVDRREWRRVERVRRAGADRLGRVSVSRVVKERVRREESLEE